MLTHPVGFFGGAPSGGAPVVETTAITQGGGNLADHPITMPSGIEIGDLLLVIFSVKGEPFTTVDTGVSGSNWTLTEVFEGGGNVVGVIVWKIAEGSDALELDTDGSRAGSAIAHRISGASTLDFSSAFGTGSPPNPPNHTPSGGSDNYLWLATSTTDRGDVTGAPTNYNNFITTDASFNEAKTATATRVLEASSEDPGVFTIAANKPWVGFTIAIPPI